MMTNTNTRKTIERAKTALRYLETHFNNCEWDSAWRSAEELAELAEALQTDMDNRSEAIAGLSHTNNRANLDTAKS